MSAERVQASGLPRRSRRELPSSGATSGSSVQFVYFSEKGALHSTGCLVSFRNEVTSAEFSQEFLVSKVPMISQ